MNRPTRVVQFRLSDVLAIFFLAALILPLASQLTNGLRGTWLVFLLWTPFALSETSSSRLSLSLAARKFEAILLLLFFSLVVVNALLGRGYTGGYHVMVFITLAMVWTVEAITSAQERTAFRNITLGLFMLIGLDAMRSLPHLWGNPGYPRQIMTANVDQIAIQEAAFRGVGNYHLYTANALALPILVGFALRFGPARYCLLPLGAPIAIAISISTLAGAFGLMVLGLSASAILYLVITKRSFVGTVALGMVATAIFVSWLSIAASSEQANFVLSKIERLFTGVSDAGIVAGDETGRSDLFLTSWNTFQENWLFGVGASTGRENPYLYTLVGGHSSFADLLAEYGILGFGLFALFFGSIVRRVFSGFWKTRSSPSAQACLISAALYAAYSIVNPIVLSLNVISLWFFVVRGYFERYANEPESGGN